MYYVYLIKSKIRDNEIYIGSTNDLRRRLKEHNEGMEVSTKRYKPWGLLYYEAYFKETYARMREKRLKQHGNAKLELKKRIGLHKSGAGFTLIEMAISIAIILILSGVVIGYSQGSRKGIELANNESKLLGLIFNAKTLSQSFALAPPANKQICAYGVHVDTDARIILVFQDLAGDTEDCNDSDNVFTVGEALPGPLDIFYLGDMLEFGPSTDLQDIVFIPPDPNVIINNDATLSSASIAVQAKEDEDANFEIVINSFGQISTE